MYKIRYSVGLKILAVFLFIKKPPDKDQRVLFLQMEPHLFHKKFMCIHGPSSLAIDSSVNLFDFVFHYNNSDVLRQVVTTPLHSFCSLLM